MKHTYPGVVHVGTVQDARVHMTNHEELLEMVGFCGPESNENQFDHERQNHRETRKEIEMNRMLRTLGISMLALLLFSFPSVGQCEDWLQPYIAQAIIRSAADVDIDNPNQSAIASYLELDHSAQAPQKPLSFFADGSEIILIMHGCSEAAGICP